MAGIPILVPLHFSFALCSENWRSACSPPRQSLITMFLLRGNILFWKPVPLRPVTLLIDRWLSGQEIRKDLHLRQSLGGWNNGSGKALGTQRAGVSGSRGEGKSVCRAGLALSLCAPASPCKAQSSGLW